MNPLMCNLRIRVQSMMYQKKKHMKYLDKINLNGDKSHFTHSTYISNTYERIHFPGEGKGLHTN